MGALTPVMVVSIVSGNMSDNNSDHSGDRLAKTAESNKSKRLEKCHLGIIMKNCFLMLSRL